MKKKLKNSGVVPFRYHDGMIEVLLVKTKSGKRWITPKGKIEKQLTPQESALKEAHEEGGILGKISGDAIGIYRSRSKDKRSDGIIVYPMAVETELSDYKEQGIRERRWCHKDEVISRVTNEDLLQIIMETFAHAENLLARGGD